jgi:hypothetical protein
MHWTGGVNGACGTAGRFSRFITASLMRVIRAGTTAELPAAVRSVHALWQALRTELDTIEDHTRAVGAVRPPVALGHFLIQASIGRPVMQSPAPATDCRTGEAGVACWLFISTRNASTALELDTIEDHASLTGASNSHFYPLLD